MGLSSPRATLVLKIILVAAGLGLLALQDFVSLSFNSTCKNDPSPLPATGNKTGSSPLRPCRVAVTNRRPYHYEILESMASQFPVEYMNLPIAAYESSYPSQSQQPPLCDSQKLHFDYFGVDHETVVGIPIRDPFVPPELRRTLPQRFLNRFHSYRKYFNKAMRNRDARPDPFWPQNPDHHASLSSSAQQRWIGNFFQLDTDRLDPNEKSEKYDVVIEASCFCEQDSINWLLAESKRICIFHFRCDPLVFHPRSVWISPHHQRFFLPTLLPLLNQSTHSVGNTHEHEQQQQQQRLLSSSSSISSSSRTHKLCVVGDFERRASHLLVAYLASQHGQRSRNDNRFRLELIGGAHEPRSFLQNRSSYVKYIFPKGYEQFYRQILTCDGILGLVSPDVPESRHYFNSTPDSHLMLSGTLSILIQYKLPFVIHDELFNLYQDYIAPNVPHQLHGNDVESFIDAMVEFLDDLDVLHP